MSDRPVMQLDDGAGADAHGGSNQIPGSRGTSVPHLVCVLPNGSGEGKHYAAHEVELLAAHDLFEQHHANGRPVSCTGLTRID